MGPSIERDELGLSGRIALVTGGGRGLGREICIALAEAGAVVVAADVDGRAAKAVAAEMEEAGGSASHLELDVADAAQVTEGVRTLEQSHGRLDVLVNNAGIDVTMPVEELDVEDFDRVLAVNLRGPFVLSKAALPIMRRAGGGHIVNVTSTAAKRAWANAAAYHASKWGLLGLSHALHVEGREAGVKVTAVVAGGMRTPFLLGRFPDIDRDVLQDPRNVAEAVRFVLTQPRETVIPELLVLPARETSWP